MLLMELKKYFNLFLISVFFKELYEENFTNLISCYEIQIKLKKFNEKKIIIKRFMR